MNPLQTILIAAALFANTAAWAQSGSASPLFGTWAVDVSRLPMAPALRPKSVTITFSEAASNGLRTRVDVVDPSGKRMEADGVSPLNGLPTEVKSNFEADVSATSMPRPEVLIMQLGKNGRPASTRIYAVSPDGNAMVETVAYFNATGQPVLRQNHFSRVRLELTPSP